jgi:(p)ppGpp synthase/HD superfamily hydrolase
MNNDLVYQARIFAVEAHNSINQKRKFTGEPYHVHPARVAALVASVSKDKEMIAAAWMHDVLEDVTPHNPQFNVDKIERIFGQRVLTLVLELTDVSKPCDGNRATRKAIDRLHTAQASDDGKTIKIADMLDNLQDISLHDPHFARVFRHEVKLCLPFLQTGNPILLQRLEKSLLQK